MKKSNFVTLVMSTVGGILLAIGMCMSLLPEWNAFKPGIVLGLAGLVVLLAMVAVRRKMENKAPIKWNGKTVLTVLVGIVGALALGIGMCMTMVWGMMIVGILVGIVILLALIPICKGINNAERSCIMSKLMVTQKKIEKNVVTGYKTIEGGVVSITVLRQQLSYKKIRETLVPNSASLITFPYRFVGTVQ